MEAGPHEIGGEDGAEGPQVARTGAEEDVGRLGAEGSGVGEVAAHRGPVAQGPWAE